MNNHGSSWLARKEGWRKCGDMEKNDIQLLRARDLAIPKGESQEELVHRLRKEDEENKKTRREKLNLLHSMICRKCKLR